MVGSNCPLSVHPVELPFFTQIGAFGCEYWSVYLNSENLFHCHLIIPHSKEQVTQASLKNGQF